MTRRNIVRTVLGTVLVAVGLVSTTRGERLPVRIFTSADGLGSSFINSVMRDSHGFLWFCTRDGLSRFDGARFVTYQLGDKDPPSGIEAIYETRNGDYWVTTTTGTYRFHANVIAHPNPAGGYGRPVLPVEFIWEGRGVVYQDSSGQMWSGGWALYRILDQDGKPHLGEPAVQLPYSGTGFVISQILEAADGSLWLCTTEGVARVLKDGRVVFYRPVNEITGTNMTLLLDADGRVWFASGLDVAVWKPEPIESIAGTDQLMMQELKSLPVTPANAGVAFRLPQQPGEAIRLAAGDSLKEFAAHRLFQTSDRHVWLTMDRALLEFDGTTVHRYTQAHGLLPGMSRMVEDTAGNLWICGRNGLIRLDRHSLSSYTEADGLTSTGMHAITEGADGTVYFSASDHFISQFSGSLLVGRRPNVPLAVVPRWSSRHAMLDSRGDWWILTITGLYRFGGNNLSNPKAVYTERDGLKSSSTFQIYEDRKGAIWVSQYPATHPELRGLSRLEPGATRFETFGTAHGFPDEKAVSSFAEDAAGNLWLGFYEGGLARFNDDRFATFDEPAGVPKGVLTDLYLDGGGRIWLASGDGGVSRIDDPLSLPPRFVNLSTANGLSSNNIRTITGDNLGNIYLGTARGVDRISADGSNIKHYSVGEGLASDFVVDSHRDRNGIIWFATMNGLSRLVPAAEGRRNPPAIWLGGVKIAGVPLPVLEMGQTSIATADLNHTQNTLQVDFFGLDFRAGENLRYQYKLEGGGGDWSAPTDQRTLTLASLQPGAYRLLVRAMNTDGSISAAPAEVRFRILPPFWLRWWFLALCGLAVVGVIVAGFSYRTARLRQQNEARAERIAELERVRNRIATDLHDDIGASLTQIAVLSEVAQAQSNGNGASAKPLKTISDVSNELVETMSDIVWSINPGKDRLSDLTQRMRRFASDVLTAKDIAIKFNAPERDLPLDTNLRREVFLIFKESINNAVKHSGATRVQIDFKISDAELSLTISDNGSGFALASAAARASEGAEKGGNGLTSMQKRAAAIRGVLEFDTEPGRGTKISLRLPLAQSGNL